MANILTTRIKKLEGQFPATSEKPRRFIRIVAGQGKEAAALHLAESEGYDIGEGSDDIVVVRSIVPMAGQTAAQIDPYVYAARR